MAKIAIIIFLIYFSFYVYNLCPAIPPRDSGELIAVSQMLGIAHPPGYPLYALLGRLFSFIPIGNIAYRINLLSAFFGAVTCVILYKIVRNIIYELNFPEKIKFDIKEGIYEKIKSNFIGIITASYLAFNPIFFSESTATEVFTLNSFFAVILIYVLLTNIKNHLKYIITAFILGLGLTNHQTLIFLFPAVVFKMIYDLKVGIEKQQPKIETQNLSEKKENLQNINHSYFQFFSRRTIIFICFSFLVGISLYLYLPLRSIHNPEINWGNAGESIKNFTNIITRKSYGLFKLHPEMSEKLNFNYILGQLKIFLNINVKSFGLIIIFLIFIKVTKSLINQATTKTQIVVAQFIEPNLKHRNSKVNKNNVILRLVRRIYGIFYNFMNTSIDTPDKPEYDKRFSHDELVSASNLIFLLTGAFFSGPVLIVISRMPLYEYAQSMLDRFYLMYFVFIILLITLFNKNKIYIFFAFTGLILNLVFFNNKTISMRNQFISFDFGMNIIRSIGRNSIIFIKGDSPVFLTYCLKHTFKSDNNNIFISENMPEWRVKQYVNRYSFDKSLLNYTGKEFLARFINRYLKEKNIFTTGIPSNTFNNINVNYYGLVNRLSLPYNRSKENNDTGKTIFETSYIMRGSYIPGNYQFFIKEIIKQYSSSYNLLATEYALKKEYDKALKMIYNALKIDRKFEDIYMNWGSILFLMNKLDEAKEKYNQALTINPEMADVYSNIGAIYGQQKDYETALSYFRKALSKNPNMQEAKNNIKILENLLKK